MTLPFYFGADEGQHFTAVANLAHMHSTKTGGLKVLAVGPFQGSYWHKHYPEDLLFCTDVSKGWYGPILEPSYTTYLPTQEMPNTEVVLGVTDNTFDVVVVHFVNLVVGNFYKEVIRLLDEGGVLVVVDGVTKSLRGSSIVFCSHGWHTSERLPYMLPWLKEEPPLTIEHLSVLPKTAYASPKDVSYPGTAPLLFIATKETQDDTRGQSQGSGEEASS